MAYLEGVSWRSSETFRQWFKKLQCIFPVNFSRNNLKPNITKILQLNGNVIGDDVFPTQQNLNVIMNTLRRDLVNLLRKSDCNNTITLLIYKLNILDNNIREICRFQYTWINHPLSTIESLKVQEKYIIKLIEEIMDNIFDTYSSIRRRMQHFSFNERNINGIISVLGILKREVCNMIHVIITSIELRHKKTFYDRICAPPNAIFELESIDNRKTGSPLPIKSFFKPKTIAKEVNSKSSQASLPSNRSYPFIEKSNGRIFSSLQNICCGLSGNRWKENSDCFNTVAREDVGKNNCDVQRRSKEKTFSNVNKTDGRGDADKNQNEISFNPMRNSVKFSYKREDTPGISKTINTYLSYAEKNKSSLLSYNMDHSGSKNIKETRGKFDSRKHGNQEQDDSRTFLCEKSSKLSWPSATVVRDIKSETNLDGISKFDRIGRNDNCKHYYSTDESSKENLSESDSDDSYISCVLDEFQLETNFLKHIKEKYLQHMPYKKTLEDYGERNNTKIFSCNSPKLSEIFTGPRIITRNKSRVSEVYHSVESLHTIPTCIEELSNSQLSRETKNIDVAITTENEIDLKALGYKKASWNNYEFDEKEPPNIQKTLIDCFNTLALSEDYGGSDARYTESIVSFASVATETMEVTDKEKYKDNPSVFSHKYLQKQRTFQYKAVASPNLEDSQYSAICLALPPSNIRLVNTGNEVDLIAIEVEQT